MGWVEGGLGFSNFFVEILFNNQDINLIYFFPGFLFPWGMFHFLINSLDFGFGSYRLSLLIGSYKFKQKFIHEKQLHIYIAV